MSTPENPLVVVNTPDPLAKVAQQMSSLQRLFQLKPSILELVSKSTTKENAKPGTFRVTSTNESFETMKAVMLYEPIEQREKYRKGEYSKESKECFSLDNFQPHAKASNPPAMYCATCPDGDIMWDGWRAAKARGISGDQLSAMLPKCKKYWHLFLADRATQTTYYFNVKGLSVKNFEDGMQNMARIFAAMYQNIKVQNKTLEPDKQIALPTNVGDLIWQVSFTMYSFQKAGGPFQVGFKDFALMSPQNQAEFGKIITDFKRQRNAGQIQSQEAAEAEAEVVAAATETPSNAGPLSSDVAKQNSQIEI